MEEETVEGYHAIYQDGNIINRHEPEKIDIPVEKVWNDANDQDGVRSDAVTVKLLADNRETVILDAANHWNASFHDLDKYTDGREIVYTVEEESSGSYVPAYTGDMQNGFVITNTYEPEKTYVDVRKVWDDEEHKTNYDHHGKAHHDDHEANHNHHSKAYHNDHETNHDHHSKAHNNDNETNHNDHGKAHHDDYETNHNHHETYYNCHN